MNDPIPAVPLRVGVYISPAVRDVLDDSPGVPVRIGDWLVEAVERDFPKAFASVVFLYDFPAPAKTASSIDAILVVERPRFIWRSVTVMEHHVDLSLLFVLCTVKGARVDALETKANSIVAMNSMIPAQNESAGRESFDLVTRSCIRQFLSQAPAFCNRRF